MGRRGHPSRRRSVGNALEVVQCLCDGYLAVVGQDSNSFCSHVLFQREAETICLDKIRVLYVICFDLPGMLSCTSTSVLTHDENVEAQCVLWG